MAAGSPPSAARTATYTSTTVDKAIDILFAVADARDGINNVRLSRDLSLDRSTTHRLVTTLERRGLLRREAGRGFLIGDRLNHLALSATPDPRIAVLPTLTDLVALTGESASFSIRHGDAFYCVAHQLGAHDLNYSPVTASSYPLHSGAAGLALWAFLPERAREELLDTAELRAFTTSTVTDRDELRSELDQARDRGYATSAGVRTPGGCSVAAPVLTSTGTVIGSLAISAADVRVPLHTLVRYHPQLRDAAARLARALAPSPEQR